MARTRLILTGSLLLFCSALMGCRGNAQGGSGQGTGNSSVVLAMTDLPPSNVTVLSAQVTLTGATLTGATPTPGNVSLFSGTTTVDLSRLQTDIAYLATATKIPAGTYTSITLTFANPKLTFENDTTRTLAGCGVGNICTYTPTATNLSATIPLTFVIASNSSDGLLVDVNLENLLSSSLGEDFSAGTTVTSFTPAGTGAPAVGAEDVVGQVTAVNASANTFTLQNATASYSLKVDSTSTFLQFPTSACSTAGFSCLKANQILSVDIGIESDGSIAARNILFEDADNSDAEIEGGVVTNTNAAAQQFDIVIQTMSAAVTGLSVGQQITVQYSTVSPQTTFDVDFVHADNSQINTSSFVFASAGDLVVGQQVSIRRNSASTASLLKADRVHLRSSRITNNVQNVALPQIFIAAPSLISGHGGGPQVTALTSTVPSTIYFEIGKTINSSNIVISEQVSARGPVFNSSGRTLVASKVVVH